MQKLYYFLLITFIFNSVSASFNNDSDSAIVIDSSILFTDTKKCIHAICFDSNNQLYVAGCNEIYKVAQDKSLISYAVIEDKSEKTIIWAMRFDKNDNLYLAAHDRIIMISPDKSQRTIIQEDFSGPCGATDLRIDKSGKLYIAYDDKIAVFEKTFSNKMIISAKNTDIPIKWAVGIELSDKEDNLFVGDCFGNKLVSISLTDSTLNRKNYNAISAQYITKDQENNIYAALNGQGNAPEFIMLKDYISAHYIYCRKKPFQNENNYKKAIVFGNFNNKQSIYCIIGSKIYVYPLEL